MSENLSESQMELEKLETTIQGLAKVFTSLKHFHTLQPQTA